MAKTIREVDEDKVKDYKEDIDTLLVFVRPSLILYNVSVDTYPIDRSFFRCPYSVRRRLLRQPVPRQTRYSHSAARHRHQAPRSDRIANAQCHCRCRHHQLDNFTLIHPAIVALAI